jgi:nicotinamide phosphoribosyltransferase
MSLSSSIIFNADSYKASHFLQYPPQTEFVSSYIEPRNTKGSLTNCVFFGLQIFLLEVLSKPITLAQINTATDFFKQHGVPFNTEGWLHILEVHGGYLPLKIEALAEGTVVPCGTPVVQVVNTDPECFWLTSYVETAILRAVWYPSTVATLSYACHKLIKQYMKETCDTLDKLPFMLNDFGSRGTTSLEASGIGGAAHLLSFMGTDNLPAILTAQEYYYTTSMLGYSIAAAEHSTITSWGREGEKDAYENMLNQFSKPGSLVAVVSDSYDLFNAIENIWGEELKEKIQTLGGTLVVRPDSGDPIEVIKKSLELLEQKFGVTYNSKGYKVLPDCVRLIQGDGINLESLEEILKMLKDTNYSLDNIAFGMGGGLLQQVNRDTMGWAMKASAVQVNGIWRDVYKDPITSTSKRSKKGVLAVVKDSQGNIQTVRQDSLSDNQENLLKTVYYNNISITNYFTFEQVRDNLMSHSN